MLKIIINDKKDMEWAEAVFDEIKPKQVSDNVTEYNVSPSQMTECLINYQNEWKRFMLVKRSKIVTEHQYYETRDLTVDRFKRAVSRKDELIYLTLTEWTLLEELLEYNGRVVSREFLKEKLEHILNRVISNNSLNVDIGRLRKKISPGEPNKYIRTFSCVGYAWVGKVTKK